MKYRIIVVGVATAILLVVAYVVSGQGAVATPQQVPTSQSQDAFKSLKIQ